MKNRSPEQGRKPEQTDVSEHEALMARARELYKSKEINESLRQEVLWDAVLVVAVLHERNFDTICFVDKSARPLASMYRNVWRRLYPNEEPPEMKFVAGHTGPSSMATPEKIRDAFKSGANDFDGKNVLVFDEARSTGASLENVTETVREAFPEANIAASTHADFTVGARKNVAERNLVLFNGMSSEYNDGVGKIPKHAHGLSKLFRNPFARPHHKGPDAEVYAAAGDESYAAVSPSAVFGSIGKNEQFGLTEAERVIDALLASREMFEDTRDAGDIKGRRFDRADINEQLKTVCGIVLNEAGKLPEPDQQKQGAVVKKCQAILHEFSIDDKAAE